MSEEMKMSLSARVARFNAVAGKPAKDELDWNLLKQQAERILEEAKEIVDGINARDIVQVVDGWCDVEYTQAGLANYLDALGINLACCKDVVALNNDQKYTISKEFAQLSAAQYVEPCQAKQTNYEGVSLFAVIRESDGKVMKLLNHVSPDLTPYIPKDLMKKNSIV
jgi:hypothetical protein